MLMPPGMQYLSTGVGITYQGQTDYQTLVCKIHPKRSYRILSWNVKINHWCERIGHAHEAYKNIKT
jgi:hypothetical protein